MQPNSVTKRPRAGSVSGRLRSASELFNEGLISLEQKSIIRDLLVTGDKQLEQSLDSYIQGNKSDIINLINNGHLKERKSTFDFLDNFQLDSLDLGPSNANDRAYQVPELLSDTYYMHPRTNSMNPFAMMKFHDSSIVDMPPNDFAFENQPKNTIETTYSSQFGNFLDYQNERDSDYLDGNMLPYNNDNHSDSMSPPHTAYPETFQSLSFLNNSNNNYMNTNNYSFYPNYQVLSPQMAETPMSENGVMIGANSMISSPMVSTGTVSNTNMQYSSMNQYTQSQLQTLQKPPPIKTDSSVISLDISKHDPGKKYIGAYSPESRRRRIEKFLEKRKQRVWTKRVKYDVRKNFADSRLRVKGRFVKKEDEELLRDRKSVV